MCVVFFFFNISIIWCPAHSADHFHLTVPKQTYTGNMAGLQNVERQRGGIIRLEATGVHTAEAVASLMGFNTTQHCHHNGTVNPLRWETTHMSALINTHRCRCNDAHTHTPIISDLSILLNKNNCRSLVAFLSVVSELFAIHLSCSCVCELLFLHGKKEKCGIWLIKTDNLTN